MCVCKYLYLYWQYSKTLCISLPHSTNYGKFFEDVTNLINNTFIRSEFGIALGPENSGKVGGRLSLFRCLQP